MAAQDENPTTDDALNDPEDPAQAAAPEAPEADASPSVAEDEVREDHGHSEEGRVRGEELSPDELGVSRVLEVSVDYVSALSFEDLGLSEVLLEAVQARGYAKPTPVQAAAFPRAMEGVDLVVRSKTGTGKTAAFLLPLLERIPAGDRRTRAIVLAPTRELAIQVADEGIALSRYKDVRVVPIYGGVGLGLQVEQLRDGAEVVVGTPGRMLDHLRRGNLDLSNALVAVLDEADEMLSMGFLEEVTSILKYLPKDHQTLLFSATVDASVAGIIHRFMREPEEILLSADTRTVNHIRNILYEASDAWPKARSLLYILYLEAPESAIIFCNTRDDCAFVTAYLNRQGFDTEFINSDLPQKERERVMARIKRGELSFLVATDIAARGIDISDLTHVINYSLPEDPNLYIHRVGRTGRIGKLGTAISITTGRDLTNELALTRVLKIPFERKPLPTPDEAARLWTERHLVSLREAADSTAYEGYLPMVKDMVRSLPEDERNRLFATAMRVFFSWYKTSRHAPANEEGQEGASSEDPGARGPRDDYRRDRGRDRDRGRGRDDRRRDDRGGDRSRDARGDDRRPSRGDDRSRDDRGDRNRREGRPDERRDDRGDRSDGNRRESRPDERRESRPDERRRDDRGDANRREGRSDERREGRSDERRRDDRGDTNRREGRSDDRRREGGPDRRPDERRRDDRPRGGDQARGPSGGEPRSDRPRSEGRGRDDRFGGRDRGQDRGGRDRSVESASREPARRPPEDLLDPLAAFAAANDIDLDSWIDTEEPESLIESSEPERRSGGTGEPAPAENEAGDAASADRKRRRRRGGRRRRRGRREGGEDAAQAGPGGEASDAGESGDDEGEDFDAADDEGSADGEE